MENLITIRYLSALTFAFLFFDMKNTIAVTSIQTINLQYCLAYVLHYPSPAAGEAVTMDSKTTGGTVLVPPANHRVEFNGSGAPSRMFEAGFGRSQGWRRPKCRLRRSVRPVGRDEGTREAGGLPGGRLLVLFAKESGLSKVTRQAA